MPQARLKIIDGPDKPAMLWSIEYSDRGQSVQFKTNSEVVEAILSRIDEHADGIGFSVEGTISSGVCRGQMFSGTYNIGSRTGELSVGERSTV